MRSTLVDSNILIDVFDQASEWHDWSAAMLAQVASRGPLVINPLILAELAARYERAADLEAALAGLPLAREPLPWDAAFLAGQAFRVYRLAAGAKTSPMPDFYIGAHALVCGMRLLTRDVRRYRNYFPRLDIVGPCP